MARKQTRSHMPVYRAILAIDPGASAGAALFVDGQYKCSVACGGASHSSLVAALKPWEELYTDIPVEQRLCIVEDGFGRGIGSKTLDRRRGLCMAAAETVGFPETVFKYPSTWQDRLFGGKVEDTKASSVAWARAHGCDSATSDEADAFCIGWYFAVDSAI